VPEPELQKQKVKEPETPETSQPMPTISNQQLIEEEAKDPTTPTSGEPKEAAEKPSTNEEADKIDSDSSLSLLSSDRRRGNKDILGMLGEELDQQTDFMCEE
jgi:hypothetical protein